MTIRYLANLRLPTEKAHGIQIMSMCNAFASFEIDIELVVPNLYNKIKQNPFDYYGIKKSFPIRYLKTFDLTRFGAFLGPIAYILQTWSFGSKALKDARESPADIYYHRDPITFIRFTHRNLPSVWEVHTIPSRFYLYRKACEKAEKIVTVSRGAADKLIELGISAEKIVIAPAGVDVKKFRNLVDKKEARKKLGLNQSKMIVLYTGQLYPWKGVDVLIKASNSLPHNISVIIVGGSDNDIKKLKINANVTFVGQVKHSLVPLYLAAADIVVIPNSRKEKISEYYTSPLKLSEAVAAGKAIIASRLPSLCEILDDNTAYLIPPDDPSSLRSAIIALAKDEKRRERLSSFALKNSKVFDWKIRAKKILDNLHIQQREKNTT